MKLAGLGVVAVAVGIAVGVDGLVLSGGVWIVLGTLVWAIVGRRERERRKALSTGDAAVDALQRSREPEHDARYAIGLALVFAVGIASLAIGILEIGFEDGSGWRWAPVAVGAIVTVVALISLVARLGGADLAAAAGEATTPATVTIEGKRQTGVYINEQPRIEFDLLVEPEGLPAYRIEKKATVPHTALSDIGIGDGFEARVDPGNQQRIAIDWNAPIEGDHDADAATRLERLEDLRRRGLIDGEEYEAQRRRIIGSV